MNSYKTWKIKKHLNSSNTISIWSLKYLVRPCILSVLIVLHTLTTIAGNSTTIDPVLSDALLSEDWERLTQLLSNVNTATSSPVLRLIKGHASLALNRNNEAISLFMSARTDDELKQWDSWTQLFFTKSPADNMIPLYLRGDALARSKQWESAIDTFGKALLSSSNHPLLLNARGVCFAFQKKWDQAFDDFSEAVESAPALAEVHASYGSLWIQKQVSPWEAIKAFDRTLAISPEYLLALNGRGGVRIVLDRFDDAELDLEKATRQIEKHPSLTNLAPVIENNLTTLLNDRTEAQERMIAQWAGEKPGTSIDARAIHAKYGDKGVAEYKGMLLNSISHNSHTAGIMQNLHDIGAKYIRPTADIKTQVGLTGARPELKMTTGIKAHDLGGMVREGIRNTGINMHGQVDALKTANKEYRNIAPKEMSDLHSFIKSHSKFKNYTGGVTPEGLGRGPIIGTVWSISTAYGLIY